MIELSAMATTKLLFGTFRFTVTRRNDGSIEIAPKGNPKATRIFHKRAKRYEVSLRPLTIATGWTVSTVCANGCLRNGRISRKPKLRNDDPWAIWLTLGMCAGFCSTRSCCVRS